MENNVTNEQKPTCAFLMYTKGSLRCSGGAAGWLGIGNLGQKRGI